MVLVLATTLIERALPMTEMERLAGMGGGPYSGGRYPTTDVVPTPTRVTEPKSGVSVVGRISPTPASVEVVRSPSTPATVIEPTPARVVE
jgi:hypothetical protein